MVHLDSTRIEAPRTWAPRTWAARTRVARRWMLRASSLTAWQVAAVLLVIAVLASFFPLRFTASASLVFDLGTQPPAASVKGVAQLLASREMAYDVVQRLGPDNAARIAGGSLAARLGIDRHGATEGRSETMRAAWRLMGDLDVTPSAGGRDISLSLSAPTPALAARAADTYVAAFLALDAATRASAGDTEQLPPLRRGAPGSASFLPDPPRPIALCLLLAAAFMLVIARRNAVQAPKAEGPVDRAVLPVELQPTHRIAWLGGTGAGLDEAGAVDRLAAQAGPPGGACHLILLTSEDLPEASARCAITLARRLSEDARVALVALDGAAESLAALVADPWAPGMSELLFGVAGFGETIHRDAKSRAHVIPPGRDARGGSAMVAAERLALVLESLRLTYDYVVVASPNLGAARGGQRLAALDPLVVCITADTAPSTAAVESFDALAERHFSRVVMLCLASGRDDEVAAPQSPVPTLDAAEAPPPPRHEAAQYAGAA